MRHQIVLNGFGAADEIEKIVSDLKRQHNVGVMYSSANIADPDEIEDMVDQARAEFGGVDILVNNAGIQHVDPIEEFPVDKWNARGGKLVGIVSRSNLIQALASSRAPAAGAGAESDRKIRLELLDRLGKEDWTDFGGRNIIVSGGIVHLWRLVGSAEEHKALLALAEGVPGVASVSDEMIPGY